MRFVIATTLAVSLGAGSALAQSSEISLGWYEDNWEATTFPSGDGGWNCSVDSRADNFPSSDGAWVFVFPRIPAVLAELRPADRRHRHRHRGQLFAD